MSYQIINPHPNVRTYPKRQRRNSFAIKCIEWGAFFFSISVIIALTPSMVFWSAVDAIRRSEINKFAKVFLLLVGTALIAANAPTWLIAWLGFGLIAFGLFNLMD